MGPACHSNRAMDSALCVFAGDVCLRVDPEMLQLCKGLEASERAAPNAQWTWLCKDTAFFTLFKLQRDTLLFSHGNGVLYHASPMAHLAPACPSGTAFLCQFTFDSLPEGRAPKLLAFDTLSPLPAEQRGERLRALAVHLPQPACSVQWVGPRQYLSAEFVGGLPHPAAGLFSLSDDPLLRGPTEELA